MISDEMRVPVDEACERWPCCTLAAGRAAGAGTLAAGSAALRSYVGQVATAEPAESLTETKRQSIPRTNCSCAGDRAREVTHRLQTKLCYIITEWITGTMWPSYILRRTLQQWHIPMRNLHMLLMLFCPVNQGSTQIMVKDRLRISDYSF